MKIYNILLVIFFVLLNLKINSQVILSPKIGLSYLPYSLKYIKLKENNKPDFLIGVNSSFLIGRKFRFGLNISYIFRKDLTVSPLTFNPNYVETKYINNDLSLNLDLLYQLRNRHMLGGGIGFVHKLSSHLKSVYINKTEIEYLKKNKFLFMCVNYSYSLNYLDINFKWIRMFENEIFNSGYLYEKFVDNRFDVTFSYPLGKKES